MSRAYDAIAAQLLAMTDDAGNWKPCWHRARSIRPRNFITGAWYRGANVLSLWASQEMNGYERSEWGSFRQWLDKGQCVRKGEKGTPIVYWGQHTKPGPEDDDVTYRFARGSYVFNIAQVAPLESSSPLSPLIPLEDLPPNPDAAIAGVELFVAETHARIVNMDGTIPCFIPSVDEIRMPPFERFHSAVGYYGTLLHELTHWTGHKSRLDRLRHKAFGDEDYALEELVAELGAAFLCADLGIENEPRADHAAYLACWHKALKKDVPAFMAAVGKASEAAAYLHQLQQPEVEAA